MVHFRSFLLISFIISIEKARVEITSTIFYCRQLRDHFRLVPPFSSSTIESSSYFRLATNFSSVRVSPVVRIWLLAIDILIIVTALSGNARLGNIVRILHKALSSQFGARGRTGKNSGSGPGTPSPLLGFIVLLGERGLHSPSELPLVFGDRPSEDVNSDRRRNRKEVPG